MNLTKRNYFSKKANEEFMSVSQFKSFEKCQAAALAEINGEFEREKTTSLLVGSYVDAYFEGSLKSFTKHHPELFKKDGTLKAEYAHANVIIERIKRDELFMSYLSGQKQVVMAGVINGVKVKAKIDDLHADKIVDLKIMRDFENVYVEEKGTMPWFEAWEYDLQGAVYQEVVRQNTGELLPFYLAAATKEKTPDIDIVHIQQKYMDFALDRFKQDVEMYDAVKKGIMSPERCGKCEYCKKTKSLVEPTEADEFYLF